MVFMKRNKNNYWCDKCHVLVAVFAVMLPISFIFSLILSSIFSNSVYAEAHQSTITLGANTDTLSVNLRPSVSGSFDKSAECTINVRTDNFTGYTLSIASASVDPDHATSLTDGNGNYIESISSNVSEADFKNSANTQYNNKWGYKPSQYIQSGTVIPNENYLPSPSLGGNLLDITSAANSNDNTYTITLGARIDSNIPAGSYANDFIVYAVANDIVYNINYNKNTEDEVTNMPSPNPEVVTIEGGTPTEDSYATLSNSTPTRTGYTFAGWCDTATTLDPNTGNQVCNSTVFQPNSEYGIDQTAGPNVVLYAIWNLNTFNITLDGNGATNTYTTSTTATYGATTLGSIATLPTKSSTTGTRTISGFSAGTGATDATITYNSTQPSESTCTAANNCKSTNSTSYTFNGWHDTSGTGTLVASSAATPALQASTTYTNSSGQWTSTSNNVTLYAGWNSSAGSYSSVTLPTIEKTGHSCHWNTNSSDTGTTYNSGASVTPGSNLTLTGFCTVNSYTITFNGDSNITNFTVDGATVSKGGTKSLVYGQTYAITINYNTGYTAAATPLQKSSGAGTVNGTNFTVGAGIATLYANSTANTYSVTLDRNCSTTASGSTSTTATYNSTTLAAITVPTCSNSTGTRTISGFTAGTNASDATVTYNTTQATGSTCSAANNCKSTNSTSYTFNGWHDASGTGTLVASSAATPALQANVSGYTDGNSKWTRTSGATLYAGWNASAGSYSAVTLPSITKTGYTCGWSTSSTATDPTYSSGGSLTPTGNTTLYGICKGNSYNLTINFAGSGVSSVQVRTASGTGGTLTGTVSSSGGSVSLVYGNTYYIYPVYSNGYEYDSIAKTSGTGILGTGSNPTWVVGAGAGTITVTGKSKLYMQNMSASDCTTTTKTVYDIRDEKAYTVTRLTDGKCWMTTNLNLAGGTTLSSADTDMPSNYTLPIANGFQSGNKLPASATAGFDDNTKAFVYNSTKMGTDCSSPGCYGYYSWTAATLGSGLSITTDNTDVPYSICPKGWHLPSTRWGTDNSSDFRALMIALGGSNSVSNYNDSTTPTGATMSSTLRASPNNFQYTGEYYNGRFNGGTYGYYWSATSAAENNARNLFIFSSSVSSADGGFRKAGYAVRCVLGS